MRCTPTCVAVDNEAEYRGNSTVFLKTMKLVNALPRALNLGNYERERIDADRLHTFTASVRSIAITSRVPPRTWFSGSSGLYSQIACVVSRAATEVIAAMKSPIARFNTCAKHLKK